MMIYNIFKDTTCLGVYSSLSKVVISEFDRNHACIPFDVVQLLAADVGMLHLKACLLQSVLALD